MSLKLFNRQEKIILLLMATIQFTHIVDFMILMPLGPQLMRAFNIGPDQFGLLVSSYTFAAGFSGFFSSFVIDRFDRKTGLLGFFIGFSVGTIACAISRNYETLLISRALTGIFGGVLGSMIMTIIGDSIPFERRGTAFGITMSSFSFASVVGVPFSLFLANHFDWHSPFMFLGVLSLFVSIMISQFLPSMRAHLKGPREAISITKTLGPIFNSKSQIFALLFMSFLMIGQFSIIPYLSPSYVANAGLPETHLPFIYLTGGIMSLFSSPFFGRLTDKHGQKKIFTFGVLLSLLPILVITHLSKTDEIVLLLINLTFFFSMSGRMVPAMNMITSTSTNRHRASFMSIVTSVQSITNGFASFLASRIVEKGPAGGLIHFQYVGYIAITFSALTLLLIKNIHPVSGNDK